MSRGPYADPVVRNPNRRRRGDWDPRHVSGIRPVSPRLAKPGAGRAAPGHRALAPRGGLPQRRELRPLPRRAEAAGGRAGVSQRAHRRGRALPRLRPGHRQPRPRPARVRPDLHRVRRPHGRDLPHAERPAAHQDLCGRVRARRKGIWRAAGGDRRVLGTGKRFRRQHGQSADAALAGVAGL